MNSPAGIRTSFMPIEFIITSARSADVDPDFSFGADRRAAAFTTISISVKHPVFLCITSFKKKTNE
jgi:hypothetical protein